MFRHADLTDADMKALGKAPELYAIALEGVLPADKRPEGMVLRPYIELSNIEKDGWLALANEYVVLEDRIQILEEELKALTPKEASKEDISEYLEKSINGGKEAPEGQFELEALAGDK